MNDNESNAYQNVDLNENPFNNFPVADSQQQQVHDNDNNNNAYQNTDFNKDPSNNLHVIEPPLQQVHDNESNPENYQQYTSLHHCGFTTNFPRKNFQDCNTSCIRKSYMDISMRSRINRLNY